MPFKVLVNDLMLRLEKHPQDYQDCLAIKDSLYAVVEHMEEAVGNVKSVQLGKTES
ncbi:MAG: hypothetical protein ACFHVJ_06995 [Aestuariibacter sp.]